MAGLRARLACASVAPMTRIHWSREWREVIEPDEDARFAAFAQEIAAIARDVAQRTHAPPGRVFHLKKHTGVAGVVRVLPDLPEPLASGVFAAPREYACYVRFSNGAVRKQLDGVLDVRGVALKLLGVDGERAIVDDAHPATDRTQDFLFVQTPAVPTDSFDEFLALARASVGGPLFLPFKLCADVGVAAALRILVRLAAVPQPRSLAGGTYFNAVPIKLGPAAAKLSLVPLQEADVRRGGESYRDDLVARLRDGSLAWRVRAQLYTDDRRTPIESASTVWEGAFHDVAVLTIARQDLEGERGREIDALVDRLAFNPWHALAEHRPLGKTQRARVAAYKASTAQRHAAAEPR